MALVIVNPTDIHPLQQQNDAPIRDPRVVLAEIRRLCPGWSARFRSLRHEYAAVRDGMEVVGIDPQDIAARVAAMEAR